MVSLAECKICERVFGSQRGLHLHVKKQHGINTKEYYMKHSPRKCKYSGKKISFKNIKQYLNADFLNRNELISWCNETDREEVAEYIKKMLSDRINEKSLNCAPNHIELELRELPSMDIYKEIFGSYNSICEDLNINPMFDKNLPKHFFEEPVDESIKIFIDTREQKPLRFKNSDEMKLDFGDYTAAGEHYDYTYIDRKSEGDFKATLSSGNLERFKRELERARKFNSYVFIVIESNIKKIKKGNVFASHKINLPYIWHNMRLLSHEYRDVCQFVFAQNRKGAQKIIPKLLKYGKRLWDVDLQYFIDKKINE